MTEDTRATGERWEKRPTLVADWEFWQVWEVDGRCVADFCTEPDADRIIADHEAALNALPASPTLPAGFNQRIDEWLEANQLERDKVRWGRFPIGMVRTWIDRAEIAEGVEHDE